VKKSKTSIICGLHRSGTTYVGRMLSLSRSCHVIHEPFNPVWGLGYAPPTYTYWDNKDAKQTLKSEIIIHKALSYKGNFCKPLHTKHGLQKIIYRAFGGKQHIQWQYLRLLKIFRLQPEHIIWKDPFCTFLADYLTQVCNMKMICMIRHPCAHYYSVRKQNWKFDINDLTRQDHLISNYGQGILESWWERAQSDNLVSIALLWKIMIRMMLSISNGNDNILLVRHEDLCINPEDECTRICEHLNIPFNHHMKRYVNKTTSGTAIDAPKGRVHGFKRDSKALVNLWKKELTRGEIDMILQIMEQDIKSTYNEK